MKLTCTTILLPNPEPPPFVGTRIGLEIPADDPRWRLNIAYLCEDRDFTTIDWGDGTIEESEDPDGIEHTYAEPGHYDVRISDDIEEFQFSDLSTLYRKMVGRIVSFESNATLLTEIRARCFNYGTNLQTVTLRDSHVEKIGTLAFANCPLLSGRIDLPHVADISCSSASGEPFYSSPSIAELHFAKANETTLKASSAYGHDPTFGAKNAQVRFDL